MAEDLWVLRGGGKELRGRNINVLRVFSCAKHGARSLQKHFELEATRNELLDAGWRSPDPC